MVHVVNEGPVTPYTHIELHFRKLQTHFKVRSQYTFLVKDKKNQTHATKTIFHNRV